MWILQNSTPTDPALTFRMRSGAIKTIGRTSGANFVVDAPLVSRIHCRLTAGADAIEVVDLSSTNGTFVNGKRVKRAEIKAGDSLRVGRVELQIAKSNR